MLRTAGILVVATALALAAASDASAVPRAYGGTTLTAWPVVMNTSANGARVTKIGAYWNGRCDKGSTFSYGRVASGRAIKTPRIRRGKFTVSMRQTRDLGNGQTAIVTEKVRGSLSRTGATGRWHGSAVIKDASGNVVNNCDTGDVRWSLFRNPYVYVGQTAAPAGQPVVLRLDKSRSKVTGFWTSYAAPCQGGAPVYESVDLFDIKVSDAGTIDDITQDGPRQWTTKGTIGRTSASGTFAFQNDQCALPTVNWTVASG